VCRAWLLLKHFGSRGVFTQIVYPDDELEVNYAIKIVFCGSEVMMVTMDFHVG